MNSLVFKFNFGIFETGACCEARVGLVFATQLKPAILLPLLPECMFQSPSSWASVALIYILS